MGENSFDKNKEQETSVGLQSTGRQMSKAAFNSFLKSYAIIPLNLLSTMIVSRMISQELWGFLIYASILINGSSMILEFFPPSVNKFIEYKIPEILLKGDISLVKGSINSILKIKLIVSSLCTLGYSLVGAILYYITGSIEYLLLLILSPLIIIVQIRLIFQVLFYAMKNFNLNTKILFMDKIFTLIGYFTIFFMETSERTKIISLAFLGLFVALCYLPPLLFLYKKEFGKIETKKVSWLEIKKMSIFGINYSITDLFLNISNQSYSAYLNNFSGSKYITYNNIANNVINQTQGAFTFSSATIYTDLVHDNRIKDLVRLFKKSVNFITIFTSFIIGLLYFFIGLYISILYPPEYFEAIEMIQPIVFYSYFSIIMINYESILSILQKERQLAIIKVTMYSISLVLYFFGIYYFDLYGFIICKLILVCIWVVVYIIFTNRMIEGFHVSFISLFKNFFVLIISLVSTNTLTKYVDFSSLSTSIYSWLSDVFLKLFNFELVGSSISSWSIDAIWDLCFNFLISALLFSIFMLFFVILFRILTKEDVIRIERLGIRIPFKRTLFSILKKILRKENNINSSEIKNV